MEKIRVRFAPSPTGFLHVGNARTALFNWLFARQRKGTFVLRIEDTDVERSASEYEKRLMDDLFWLGLDWDEGPYRQSQRVEIYKKYTQKLLDEGRAYYCFCSPEDLDKERREALARDGVAIYSGRCRQILPEDASRRIQQGEQAAVRLRVPSQGGLTFRDLVRGELEFDMSLIGDSIIVRSTGLPAYNFAVVIDDSLMEITHVIRGEDHISNTPRQILLYQALSLPPPQFAHLSMVMGKDNTRLSKRHGATAVDQFQKDGILPAALFNYLALLGWAPPEDREVLSKEEIVDLFDLTKVSRSAAIFDYDKLHWINRQHAKLLSARQKAEHAYPYLREANLLPEHMTEAHWKWLEKAVEVYLERVDRFVDLPSQISMLFEFSPQEMDEGTRQELGSDCASRTVRLFGEKIAQMSSFDYAQFSAIAQEIKDATGYKGRELFHPLRIILTAKGSGLDLDKFIPLVEEGSKLALPRSMKNCFQRTKEMLEFLKESGSQVDKE